MFLLLFAVDLILPPAVQPSSRLLLAAIRGYQATLSPLMPKLGVACRFQPTCSHFAAAVIDRQGTVVGLARSGWRILRCGPWTAAGSLDPP